MSMHIVVNLGCDSLGNYKRECDCDVLNGNEVCQKQTDNYKTSDNVFKCVNISDTDAYVQGADATGYFSMGVKFDINELDIHEAVDSGGWIGPYSLLMPDDGNPQDGSDSSFTSMRYVKTPYTDMIRHPDDYDITLHAADFDRLFGVHAINATIDLQADFPTDSDPFAYAKDNCDNGDVKPIMPLFDFKIDENEKLDVNFKFYLFTYPDASSIMRKVFPRLMKAGWPITGPYCYDGEMKGYAINFNYDSNIGNEYVSFDQGCVDDLPCIPDNFEACTTCGLGDVHSQQESEINLLLTEYLAISTGVLFLVACSLIGYICCLKRKAGKEREGTSEKMRSRQSSENINYERLVDEHSQNEDSSNRMTSVKFIGGDSESAVSSN